MSRILRILIADDEHMGRQVLRDTLECISDLEVVGEAENGSEALQQIRQVGPDLVFLDLEMPLIGGLELLKNVCVEHLPIVIIVTAYPRHLTDTHKNIAIDHLLKPVSPVRLRNAVERARTMLRPRHDADRPSGDAFRVF